MAQADDGSQIAESLWALIESEAKLLLTIDGKGEKVKTEALKRVCAKVAKSLVDEAQAEAESLAEANGRSDSWYADAVASVVEELAKRWGA